MQIALNFVLPHLISKMEAILNQILAWISLFVGTASLVLAGYTIWLARITERETRKSNQRTEDRMREQYEKMQAVLSAIEIRSATTEQVVKQSQEHLLSTITNLVNETLIPKKQDFGEQMGLQFMQSMLQNPSHMPENMQMIKALIELGQSAEKP